MVGRQLLEHARRRAVRCRTSSRSQPAKMQAADTWTPWDLTESRSLAELDEIFGGVDALVHAGAIVAPNRTADLQRLLAANVGSCISVGEWANSRGIPVVFISGATVYGDPTRAGIRESDDKTDGEALGGFYGLTKYLGELVFGHLRASGLKLLTLRPASIYGPGLPADKLVRDFLERARRGETLRLTQPSDDRYNLVHASDVAAAVFAALEKEALGTFNVTGFMVTLGNLAESCVAVTGRGGVRVEEAPQRAPRSLFDLDGTAATAAFGYRPSISIEQGLRTMLEEVTQSD
jgi:nucleoside-diphosphate-sugar epimerase